jgi:hypothetical protein
MALVLRGSQDCVWLDRVGLSPRGALTKGNQLVDLPTFSALSIQYGGDLNAAAAALGFPNVTALQPNSPMYRVEQPRQRSAR